MYVGVKGGGVWGVPFAELCCSHTGKNSGGAESLPPASPEAHTGQPETALQREDPQLLLGSCVGIWSISEQGR